MSVTININSDPVIEKHKVKILFFDITNCSQNVQFLLCSAAVFVFFLLYGYMQELLFTLEGFHPFGWHLTLVQFGYYIIFGLIEKFFSGISSRK